MVNSVNSPGVCGFRQPATNVTSGTNTAATGNATGAADPAAKQTPASTNICGDVFVSKEDSAPSPREYYQEMIKQNPNSTYYPQALKICNGENRLVNFVINRGMEQAGYTTPEQKMEVMGTLSRRLMEEDQAARARGEVDKDGSVKGDVIDAYHKRVYSELGIQERYYGGSIFPQNIGPNPVACDSGLVCNLRDSAKEAVAPAPVQQALSKLGEVLGGAIPAPIQNTASKAGAAATEAAETAMLKTLESLSPEALDGVLETMLQTNKAVSSAREAVSETVSNAKETVSKAKETLKGVFR